MRASMQMSLLMKGCNYLWNECPLGTCGLVIAWKDVVAVITET